MKARSSFEGRTALVTGAASGIGLAVAQAFAEAGARVVMSDVDGAVLEGAARTVPRSRALVADLSNRDAVLALARAAGDVDVLVNNAGLQHVSPIEEFDPRKWDLLLSVMLTAPFLLIKELLPGMYARDFGRVVNVASVHGLVASPYKGAYVAAKHGLLGLTKTVALEAGAKKKNVTVNSVCPSYVRTPLVERQIADQARVHRVPEEEVLDRILLTQNAVKRIIEPAEVAASVLFLCREDTWSITGATLNMDAGWLAH